MTWNRQHNANHAALTTKHVVVQMYSAVQMQLASSRIKIVPLSLTAQLRSDRLDLTFMIR
jgi:hypothetical protein